MVSPPPGAGQDLTVLPSIGQRPHHLQCPSPTPRRAPPPPPVLRNVEKSDMRGSITCLQTAETIFGLYVLVVDHDDGSHVGKITGHEALPESGRRILSTVVFTSESNIGECQDYNWDEVMGHHYAYMGCCCRSGDTQVTTTLT